MKDLTNYNDVALRANYHYGEIGNARGGVGSSSQPANYAVDFLSNGFKIRASGGSLNSGTNEVGMLHGQKHHNSTCMEHSPTQDKLLKLN